ncbi:LCP family protein [Fodinisporobacter ferrooxydans]|uniref:LCP family protein n=1 Tax=Fodinisporobacter ferrooxydans TaxID=2901836 RepID=A0ABY4CIG2_9BACL|nr:LCP family protein [Alicyclobacillaceae bacterium MYW30-H2]
MKKKLAVKIVSVLSLAILGIVGYYGYHVYRFTKAIQVKSSAHGATETWTGGRVNILLIGGDARPGEKAANSDSMIVLSVDPKTKQAQMFSVMRDTWWKIPGNGYEKINAGNLIGGPQLAVKTVENFLDIPINYYVETNFAGFKKMVDILGGVDINVDENMNYDDPTDGTSIHLKKGEQHLDGTQALNYVRFRHDAMGDFNRTKRQREFLKALAVKSESTIGLLKLPQMLDALAPYVQTNMNGSDMLKIAYLVHGLNISNMKLAQVPPMNDILQRYLPQGGDVLIPNVLATREFVHQALGMHDTVTASAAEQSYWNMYSGNSAQTAAAQAVPAAAPQPSTNDVSKPANATPASNDAAASGASVKNPFANGSVPNNGSASNNDSVSISVSNDSGSNGPATNGSQATTQGATSPATKMNQATPAASSNSSAAGTRTATGTSGGTVAQGSNMPTSSAKQTNGSGSLNTNKTNPSVQSASKNSLTDNAGTSQDANTGANTPSAKTVASHG